MKIIGRKKVIQKIEKYASFDVENKAFLGVKGLGKSLIFETAFSKEKCKMFAEEYKCLFVRTILQPEKKGEDLINFLLDRVVNGIDLLSDDEVKDDFHHQIQKEATKFHSKDSLLREALEVIKDYGYTMVLIMDEFHNMGRNSSVGSEQYDFLRSLNELGLIYYWIISDSHFSDVNATSQFNTSFFVQKFIFETIPQMTQDEILELITRCAAKNEIDIPHDILVRICGIIGGIPGFVIPAIMCCNTIELDSFDENEFINLMLENSKCISLITSWSRSLTSEQKNLLHEIALAGTIYQSEYMSSVGEINKLGDNSGLGLLVHGNDNAGKFWTVNSKIYLYYILNRTELFFSSNITSRESSNENKKATNTTYIQNNYITVNNNFFDPSSAVEALVNLKQMIGNRNPILLPDNKMITSVLHQLPYQQSGWDEMSDEKKDEKMDEFADTIFSSGDFRADSLSETQMHRFYLTNEILDNLTETSRNNLISAIQVYDLLQFCVDKFGLNMLNSESARGILFTRLYESILRENLSPALNSVVEIASRSIKIGFDEYTIGDAPIDKMTIGNYAYILKPYAVQNRLSHICLSDIHRNECDAQWWRDRQDNIYNIGILRNDCCHSGTHFNAVSLEKLLKYLFELKAIADVEIYNDITNRI